LLGCITAFLVIRRVWAGVVVAMTSNDTLGHLPTPSGDALGTSADPVTEAGSPCRVAGAATERFTSLA
jgi:hypothetical protein